MTLFDIYVSFFLGGGGGHDNTVSSSALQMLWGLICDEHKIIMIYKHVWKPLIYAKYLYMYVHIV